MRRPFAGIRGRLQLAVILAVAAALVVATFLFNFVLARSLDRDANDLLRARVAAELTALDVVHGRLRIDRAPDVGEAESQVWIFAGGRVLERPHAAAPIDRAARSLAGGPRKFAEVKGYETRLYAAPVVKEGRELGTVVAGLSLEPYEETRHTALFASLGLAAVVLIGVAAIARWLLTSALKPVAQMTRLAADWSEHDLDRRFTLGEGEDELTRLAATLDGLLDRIAASLRRERRFSAELSHELRTPLATLIAEADLALRRERQPGEYRAMLEGVLVSARRTASVVETLVSAAQLESGLPRGTADAGDAAENAVEACSPLAEAYGVALALERPTSPVRVGVDGDLVERILQPVLENACRYGRSSVRIVVSRNGRDVLYTVSDDGPGVAEAEQGRIFDPGVRGRAGSGREGEGAGLGLALARRLARSVTGDIAALGSDDGGRFVIRLPVG